MKNVLNKHRLCIWNWCNGFPFEWKHTPKIKMVKYFSMKLMKNPLEKREKNYDNAKYSLTNIELYQVCMGIILSDHVISYLPSINIQWRKPTTSNDTHNDDKIDALLCYVMVLRVLVCMCVYNVLYLQRQAPAIGTIVCHETRYEYSYIFIFICLYILYQ